jgi:hypothetical protein
MDENEYAGFKAKFFKVFATVPVPLRDEIIAVVDEDTYTWRTANADIEHDAKNAKSILIQLKKMGII